MKIRSGFVSNSSTSSFVMVGKRFDSVQELEECLKPITNIGFTDTTRTYMVEDEAEKMLKRFFPDDKKLIVQHLSNRSETQFYVGIMLMDVYNGGPMDCKTFHDNCENATEFLAKLGIVKSSSDAMLLPYYSTD